MTTHVKFASVILAIALITTPITGWAQTGAGGTSGTGGPGASGPGAPGGPAGTGTGPGTPGSSGTSDSAPSTTPGANSGGVSSMDKGTSPSPAAGGRTAPSASPTMSGEFHGRHTMTGEVTKVDRKTGMFSLKTKEGTLQLHAPASALASVKPGDRMAVEIAVNPVK